MRVVQLLPELNEGGVERGVVELNREFVARGVESVVISRGGRLAERIDRDGGRHIPFDVCSKNLLTAPSRVRGLRRLLAELKPDVVHARSRVPAWLAWLARRRLPFPFPFVTTVHGMNSVSWYSEIMTRGERVITVSEVVRDYILANYPVDPDRITVIQRGVDMKLFDPAAMDRAFVREFKERFGLDGQYIVTSVGRVTHLKDYESFIEAVARCREAIPDIVGVIVGGVAPERQRYFEGLQRLAAERGVSERIVFAGSQSRMPEIYGLSDVVVNASTKMGNVGRTVTEALAMNTPVLATTWEGLRNLVEDGLNGYIIRVKDPADLAEKLLRLHADPIADTRSTVDPEFTLEAMVESTLAVYRSLRP